MFFKASPQLFRFIALCGFALAIFGAWVGWTMGLAYSRAQEAIDQMHQVKLPDDQAAASAEQNIRIVREGEIQGEEFSTIALRRLVLGMLSSVFFPILAFALMYASSLDTHGKQPDLASGGKVMSVLAPIAMFCGTVDTRDWTFQEPVVSGVWIIYVILASCVLFSAARLVCQQKTTEVRVPLFSSKHATVAIMGFIALLGYAANQYIAIPTPYAEEVDGLVLDFTEMSEDDIRDYYRNKRKQRVQSGNIAAALVVSGYLFSIYGLLKTFSQGTPGPSALSHESSRSRVLVHSNSRLS